MVHEVAYSPGGSNLRHALKGSEEMTSTVHIYITDGSPVL